MPGSLARSGRFFWRRERLRFLNRSKSFKINLFVRSVNSDVIHIKFLLTKSRPLLREFGHGSEPPAVAGGPTVNPSTTTSKISARPLPQAVLTEFGRSDLNFSQLNQHTSRTDRDFSRIRLDLSHLDLDLTRMDLDFGRMDLHLTRIDLHLTRIDLHFGRMDLHLGR